MPQAHVGVVPVLPRGSASAYSHPLALELLQRFDLRLEGQVQPGQGEFMYGYNPSLMMLPPMYRTALRATYVASLKITNHHICYQKRTPTPRLCGTFVGLKLLDNKLQPLPQLEVLLGWDGPRGVVCQRTPNEDCRLVTLGKLLLLVCKTKIRVLHLELSRLESDM